MRDYQTVRNKRTRQTGMRGNAILSAINYKYTLRMQRQYRFTRRTMGQARSWMAHSDWYIQVAGVRDTDTACPEEHTTHVQVLLRTGSIVGTIR